jgi:SAM-dependent methyltransferase
MTDDYRDRLFRRYDLRTRVLDPESETRRSWFRAYASRAYLPHLAMMDRGAAAVLEIGCSKGLLLSILHELGFRNLTGVDLSPGDIAEGQREYPHLSLVCADALEYLRERPTQFDAIILKAVLEHIPKSGVLPFLSAIREGIRPGGIALIDVPNMDWLFAGHERYMDFTHEVGFTQESLPQIMSEVFSSVAVTTMDNDMSRGLRRFRTRVGRAVLGTALSWADPDTRRQPIWHRSLVAVGRR